SVEALGGGDVVGGRQSGIGHPRHDGPRQAHGRSALGVVQRRVGVDDVETARVRVRPVGVDRHDRVGAGPVTDGGALVDARSDAVVVLSGQLHAHALTGEPVAYRLGDGEVERVLAVAVVGAGAGGVALLAFAPAVRHLAFDPVQIGAVAAVVPGVEDHE